MSAYTFNDERRSITIHRFDLPSPWINYLSNGKLHAFVSQAGGGFLWWQHPSKCRLTRYRMYNLPIDTPGFYVYIRQRDGTVWSPAFRPAETKLDGWAATHAPGVTEFTAEKGALAARLRLFIPPDYNALTWELEVTNRSAADQTLDVFAYAELSQYDWLDEVTFGYYWRHMLKTWFDRETGALFYLYHYQKPTDAEKVPLVYFAASRPVESFSGDRDAFVGNYRDERNPVAVEQGRCGNEEILSGEPCAALHTVLECKAGATGKVDFFLGAEPGALTDYPDTVRKIRQTLAALTTEGVLDTQFRTMQAWWDSMLRPFVCEIPDPDAQRQINIWSPVHTVHVSRYERAVNTLASGFRRLGFRDTCQDMIAMTWRDPAVAERMLLHLLTLQDVEGNAISNTDPRDRKKPDLGIHSDHHLWLPFLVHALLAETGDFSLLERKAPFLSPDGIRPGRKDSVWEHLLAAMHFTDNSLGAHGLPLTLKGDWNDIIGKFSEQGRGESVFAAQQYVLTLNYLIEIALHTGREADALWLTGLRDRQVKSLLACAWNGKWWYRCFDDDGNPVGGENSEFGKIWINSQTWAVLSGTGTREQQQAAMDAVEKYLSTDVGLMKLYPGFQTWPQVTHPFSGYNPGNGENGAIFCHANTWAIIAETKLGNAERAWKYFNQLVPHNALQKMGIERYKSEPYAWASNIIGVENPKHGWSNVVHITGTAAWMDIAATQYLLGIRPGLTGLEIDPCVPGWETFRIERTWRGCRLTIDVTNPKRVSKGIARLELDGVKLEGNTIAAAALAGKATARVTAVMG